MLIHTPIVEPRDGHKFTLLKPTFNPISATTLVFFLFCPRAQFWSYSRRRNARTWTTGLLHYLALVGARFAYSYLSMRLTLEAPSRGGYVCPLGWKADVVCDVQKDDFRRMEARFSLDFRCSRVLPLTIRKQWLSGLYAPNLSICSDAFSSGLAIIWLMDVRENGVPVYLHIRRQEPFTTIVQWKSRKWFS